MKFLIVRTEPSGKTVERITGFKTLSDACHAAHALARLHRAEDSYYHIRLAKGRFGEHLTGIACAYAGEVETVAVSVKAEKELANVKAKIRQAKARHAFIKQHDDLTWVKIQNNAVIRAAFLKNDFATVLTLLKENEAAPSHPAPPVV